MIVSFNVGGVLNTAKVVVQKFKIHKEYFKFTYKDLSYSQQ